MASHSHSLTGRLARLALVAIIALAFSLTTALPGFADGYGGGGTPPTTPEDTTTADGGTSSYDGGTTDTEPVATQDGVDASWYWTIDLLLLTSAAIL